MIKGTRDAVCMLCVGTGANLVCAQVLQVEAAVKRGKRKTRFACAHCESAYRVFSLSHLCLTTSPVPKFFPVGTFKSF